MKRRRISQVGIAGILAVISAVGLIAVVSFSNGALRQINPTEEQQTVDAIVRTRLTQTAEMRATATTEVTEAAIDPIWQTATAVWLLPGTDDADPLTPVIITPGFRITTATETVTPQS